ncbi:TetR family transcriptional regulator [Maribellus comscasis]|jgi:AcrR family transcriptional regulator|uniref:TetR family transcriptional regulator n=1 Tax=Maribellus comscasis TaxID=2681766 RepID=A0A6I6JZ46_9BACT|nr:TetR/AcrR family transcriptional regulator [Maribellus comscasis]QGY46420.1 TetR family transcriptional regulator [Maribellus comscasis]
MDITNTREHIIKVAMHIFSKFGFQKTTVDEIAKAAHKAKGSVYYYFRNKEELFQSVVEKEFSTLQRELIRAVEEGETGKMKLTNYITTRMKVLGELSNMYEALKNEYLNYLGFVERIREKYDNEEVTLVKSILVQGMKNGEFEQSDEVQTAFVIVRALKGFEVPIMVSKHLEIEEKLEFMINILLRGIEKR